MKIFVEAFRKIITAANFLPSTLAVISLIVAIIALITAREANLIAKDANNIATQGNELVKLSVSSNITTTFRSKTEMKYCQLNDGNSYKFFLFAYIVSDVYITNHGGLPVSLEHIGVDQDFTLWSIEQKYWNHETETTELNLKHLPVDIDAGRTRLIKVRATRLVFRTADLEKFMIIVSERESELLSPIILKLSFGNGQELFSPELGTFWVPSQVPDNFEICEHPFTFRY